MFSQQRSGLAKGERIAIVRTTRESSTTSTVDLVSPITTPFGSPLKSQLTSPAFSKGQWQSMAVKWQVSTESRLKNSEEKLSSNLNISEKCRTNLRNEGGEWDDYRIFLRSGVRSPLRGFSRKISNSWIFNPTRRQKSYMLCSLAFH